MLFLINLVLTIYFEIIISILFLYFYSKFSRKIPVEPAKFPVEPKSVRTLGSTDSGSTEKNFGSTGFLVQPLPVEPIFG